MPERITLDMRACPEIGPHRHANQARAMKCAFACASLTGERYSVWRHALGPWVVEPAADTKHRAQWMRWDSRRPNEYGRWS